MELLICEEVSAMMPPERIPAALYAIHSILVKARWLTGNRADHQNLYKLFDSAEVLPSLIGRRPDDTTEEFREVLAEIGKTFPDCAGFLRNFDEGKTWDGPAPDAAPLVRSPKD